MFARDHAHAITTFSGHTFRPILSMLYGGGGHQLKVRLIGVGLGLNRPLSSKDECALCAT
jgi:hypothetical protein